MGKLPLDIGARQLGALALVVIGLGGSPGTGWARAPRHPAQRKVTETRNYRVVVKKERITLPAADYEGRRVEVQEGQKALVRRVLTDTKPEDGKITRSVLTTTVTHKGAGPAAWLERADRFRPGWSLSDAAYLATAKRLGPTFLEDQTNPAAGSVQVRLFAPKAREVYLVLDEDGERLRLAPDRAGVWEGRLPRAPRELYGKAYHYEVDGQKIADPYAASSGGDYGPSRFVDPHFNWQDPGYDTVPTRVRLQQRGLSEVHVKDMTAHPSSPVDSPTERGTYLGLRARRVVEHYQDLGVGGLELLPVHQFDARSGDLQDGKPTKNHWGYMTTQYLAPHRGWASKPDEAPKELKSAIDALHRAGKSVVMDVVYNHAAAGPSLHFKVLGQEIYFRLLPDGSLADGAGCKNELATEKPMVRRLLVHSLRRFALTYHVDGFRLDLGSLVDPKTLRAVDRALPPRVFLTAEPWAADAARAQWGKAALAGELGKTRLTVWNDDFRNAAWSFLPGGGGEETRNNLMNAICGSVASFGRGWAVRPTQAVNYLESHDEKTIRDRLQGNPQRAFLGMMLLLTSQGIPMLGHGQEMLRSKRDIANAHNMDNEVSWIDWGLKEANRDFFKATRGLLALRASSPHFQYQRPLTEADITWLRPGNANALGYLVRPPMGTPGRKKQPDLLVLMNSDSRESVTFELPRAGDWRVIADGALMKVDARGLRTAAGTYRLPPGTGVILSQERPTSGRR